MKRLSVLAFGVMLGVACNDDPACVIDTDCDIGEYCSAEQRCEIVGGMVDAGERDAETPMDAGMPDAGPADGGVDSGPEQIGTGSVVAINGAGNYTVVASFTLVGGASTCTVTEPSADCVLTVCPPPMMVEDAGMPDAGMVDAGMPVAPHAGVITIGGGASEMVTLTPGADGLYPSAMAPMALWTGSDAILTVMGAGDEVPMFGVTLAGPDAVTLTGPMPAAMLPVGSDLAVTWTGSSPGDVVVSMTALRETPVTVECRFEPSAGTGTIPSAALTAMGAGNAFVSVRAEQSRSISRSGWDIGVALQSPSGLVSVELQ